MDQENKPWFDGPNPNEDRFRDGFIDGFTRAREIFWRDLMRRAGEAKLMAENATSQSVRDHLCSQEVAYRNAADMVSRSHTLYPGAISPDADPEDPRFTVNYDGNLYRY